MEGSGGIPGYVSDEKPGEELTSLTAVLRPLLEKTVAAIVGEHGVTLISRPLEFIIPAVWGAQEAMKLDPLQEKIFVCANQTVEKALALFARTALPEPQHFAVAFFVRELLIYRILFQIQLLRMEIMEMANGPFEDHLNRCYDPRGSA